MERTIGFDFGTHQTKICIEEKEGTSKEYRFFTFEDGSGKQCLTLPSVICVRSDKTLTYGFVDDQEGEIIRYFKQGSFCTEDFRWNNIIRADYFSIWYISFILFQLESQFGIEFATQMGAPTDTANLDRNKRKAVSLMLSAIYLVEEVFKNDLKKFLATSIEELMKLTKIEEYSLEKKEQYGLLVFPEAYACLRPLTTRGVISGGMSLIVDIGGGTTDISFFTLEKGNAQIYKFISIPKGLNYLIGIDGETNVNATSYVKNANELIENRVESYEGIISKKWEQLQNKIEKIFTEKCGLKIERLYDALKNRPIIYSGGGSTFEVLRKRYGNFTEIRNISKQDWNLSNFIQFSAEDMCPILTTAYGLSISAINDDITITPLSLIFEDFKGAEESKPINIDNIQDLSYLNYDNGELRLPTISYKKGVRKIISQEKRKNFIDRLAKLNEQIKDITPRNEQDVDMFFAWYYENNISIGDTMVKFITGKISDVEIRSLFESTSLEWNKELKKREENKKKDIEAARLLANMNFRKIHAKEIIARPEPRKRFVRPRDIEINEVPCINNCPFTIGDKIQSINLTGVGTITSINPDNCTISFVMDDGLSYTETWKDCYKESSLSVDSYFPSQRVILQKTVEKKKQLAIEEQKQRENKKMQEGLAALLEKFNKKK